MKQGDIWVIVATLVLSMVTAFFTTDPMEETEMVSVMIEHENKMIFEMNVDREYAGIHSFDFGDKTGYVEIDQGKVRFLEMPREICPRQICSKLGWAEKPGQILVCLPNKLVGEVNGADRAANASLDGVSY